MDRLPDLNWGGPGYATYEVVMKVSGGEKTAANLQANESQILMGWMQKQFGEQQGWLNNVIMPQLQHMAINPPGFGLPAISAMRANLISTLGGQLEAQQRTMQQNFASQNMAGLGSGVQVGAMANLGAQASTAEAAGLQNIAIQNAQLQNQQREFGLQGLMQGVQQLGAAPQTAQLLNQSVANQFTEQYTMSQQGGFWTNVLRGAVGAIAGGIEGGPLGAVMGGVSGFAGGGGSGGGGIDLSGLFNQGPVSQYNPSFQPGNIGQPYYASQAPSPLNIPSAGIGPSPV